MNVFLQAFTNMLSQKLRQNYLGFASFGKYDFACFSKLSCKLANVDLQCFASFHNLLQFMVLQAFARIGKCENHGVWQRFAMSILLKVFFYLDRGACGQT